MNSRCEGCPVARGLACYALASGLVHFCEARKIDPAIDPYLVASSAAGVEPDRPAAAAPQVIDPRDVAIDLCELGSCSCRWPRTCHLSTFPVAIAARSTCLECVSP
jgi:hypothetical protein